MRGKKIDNIFVGNFIAECVASGLTSQNDIINNAKIQINNIDERIREVEKLKVKRSKLIDVIIKLDNYKSKVNMDEVDSLKFFKIKNHNICKFICDSICNNNVNIDLIYGLNFDSQDIDFTLKQLIDNEIIVRSINVLSKGPQFDKYMKYVFLE